MESAGTEYFSRILIVAWLSALFYAKTLRTLNKSMNRMPI